MYVRWSWYPQAGDSTKGDVATTSPWEAKAVRASVMDFRLGDTLPPKPKYVSCTAFIADGSIVVDVRCGDDEYHRSARGRKAASRRVLAACADAGLRQRPWKLGATPRRRGAKTGG